MRKFIAILIFFSSFDSSRAGAMTGATPPGDFGLGLMIGSIVSVTGKYKLSAPAAVDFGIGFIGQPWTVVYADYLYHAPGIFGAGTKFGRETAGYIGGGAGLAFWNSTADCGPWHCGWGQNNRNGTGLLIRGLAGFEWYPRPTRFGVFAELGPNILLVPATGGSLDIGVGGRYYF